MVKKKLNFGCGRKNLKGFENADIQEGEHIDKSFDFNNFPYPYRDNVFDYILVDNVLEHVNSPEMVLNELWRISKPKSVIKIIVPFYNAGCAYNDVTHQHFFNVRAIEVLAGFKHEYAICSVKRFNIKYINLIPTPLFEVVPKFIREKLCGYIGNVVMGIECELEVVK